MTIDVDIALKNLAKRRTDLQTGEVIQSEKMAKSRPFKKISSATRIGSYLESIFESIDDEYLRITFEQALRIRAHLENMACNKGIALEFEFQGSVTNRTAIRVSSDVDLLVIHCHFATIDREIPNETPFPGDVKEELRNLRSLCNNTLLSAFPKADVDSSGGKSISISGGSLSRKIDIVPASWHYTIDCIQNNNERVFRGITILDVKNGNFVTNFPFLHNKQVGIKDHATKGKYTALVRAIKNIRDDVIDAGLCCKHMSSYFITSLIYHIPNQVFNESNSEIELLVEFCIFSLDLINNPEHRSNLLVPNKTSKLFDDDLDDKLIESLFNLVSSTRHLVKLASNN